jgi:hypothetical protein
VAARLDLRTKRSLVQKAARLALVYEVSARPPQDGGSMIEGCYLLRRAEAQRLQRSHLNLVLADIIPPGLADL